ncbi:ankyrin repeat ph and sec7 domain containing protein secg-related [Anaeramoeba flamelloides]|uniref:Ankyrin repeat ph and sec7 domain containing protein secg-related n=1 Tax=Anaeramoeba flamelloides TaxID=1746091 RepID=A0AAV8AIX9_9EUKA|nr:ankyrin repeat ph and sec7 domain containing protein secg-related [Anaeramoeba flamelloides]
MSLASVIRKNDLQSLNQFFLLACKHSSLPIVELLLNKNVDIKTRDPYQNNCLHIACKFRCDPSVVDFLITKGAEVNCTNNNTCLHEAVTYETPIEMIGLLLHHGANPTTINNDGKTSIELTSDPKIKSLFQRFLRLTFDMIRLYNRQECTDFTLNGLKVHRIILEARLKRENIEKIETYFSNKSQKKTNEFLKWVYSSSSNSLELVKQMFEEMNFDNITFFNKNGRNNLINDLKQLYKDDSSKDFSIDVNNETIKCHRMILQARSDLYRGMFINVGNFGDKVKDYSNRSPQTIKALIRYFYLDEFDKSELSNQVLDELLYAKDYYQISSDLPIPELEELRKKIESKEDDEESDGENEVDDGGGGDEEKDDEEKKEQDSLNDN